MTLTFEQLDIIHSALSGLESQMIKDGYCENIYKIMDVKKLILAQMSALPEGQIWVSFLQAEERIHPWKKSDE